MTGTAIVATARPVERFLTSRRWCHAPLGRASPPAPLHRRWRGATSWRRFAPRSGFPLSIGNGEGVRGRGSSQRDELASGLLNPTRPDRERERTARWSFELPPRSVVTPTPITTKAAG